ncbi:MAG: DUF4956 domain-containing protein [Lachnospiraceae bacterium]|nr:DUF4956 domain-containing protein [Lachnospiraceae bacterium]
MTFKDMIKGAFIDQFQMSEIDLKMILTAMFFSFLLAFYLFVIYRYFVRKSLYNINMNIALVGMTVITTAIMLTIQSNLILSLGMVGALSIVRYRTAVKDPMDLFFLFWSIACGIMCGAKQYLLAIIVTCVLTIAIYILAGFPSLKAPYILVINGKLENLEELAEEILEEYCRYYKISSRNISKNSERLVVELRTKNAKTLVREISRIGDDINVSLVTYEGDVVG